MADLRTYPLIEDLQIEDLQSSFAAGDSTPMIGTPELPEEVNEASLVLTDVETSNYVQVDSSTIELKAITTAQILTLFNQRTDCSKISESEGVTSYMCEEFIFELKMSEAPDLQNEVSVWLDRSLASLMTFTVNDNGSISLVPNASLSGSTRVTQNH